MSVMGVRAGSTRSGLKLPSFCAGNMERDGGIKERVRASTNSSKQASGVISICESSGKLAMATKGGGRPKGGTTSREKRRRMLCGCRTVKAKRQKKRMRRMKEERKNDQT